MGLTKEQFLDLTPYDFTLLLNRFNEKKKEDFELLRMTIINSGANLLRKKGQREIPLFNKEGEVLSEDKIREEREALFGKSK